MSTFHLAKTRLALLTLASGMALLLTACAADTVDPVAITGPETPPVSAVQGEPYTGFTTSASGGTAPYVFSLNENWPTGISVGAISGLVGGTPTEHGTFTNLAIVARDARGATDAYELGADLVVLPATPVLALEALPNWWATTPPAELHLFRSLELEFTLVNISGVDLVMAGASGGEDPAHGLQIWTVPGVMNPSVQFNEYPEGTFAPGTLLRWNLTIDLTDLPDTETGFAIRPYASPTGTTGPGSLALIDSESTVER